MDELASDLARFLERRAMTSFVLESKILQATDKYRELVYDSSLSLR